ncbi:hypothetical protein GCM10022247_48370 [Allokutzneria multivorans]|uniref:Uncharacterized protein n=1 Tax=Allokutzneria multivorans TaxID=1142134 RepID=A0ABP7T051_9PSEU
MRMRSVLAAATTVLGLLALPSAAQAAPVTDEAKRCADNAFVVKGIYISYGSGDLFCLTAGRPELYPIEGATGCGPLSKGGTGHGFTKDNKKISCNLPVNFARQDMRFATK